MVGIILSLWLCSSLIGGYLIFRSDVDIDTLKRKADFYEGQISSIGKAYIAERKKCFQIKKVLAEKCYELSRMKGQCL